MSLKRKWCEIRRFTKTFEAQFAELVLGMQKDELLTLLAQYDAHAAKDCSDRHVHVLVGPSVHM